MTETKQEVFNEVMHNWLGFENAKSYRDRYERATDGDPDCPYCHDNDEWLADNGGWKRLRIGDNGVVEMWDFRARIKINYCPICGRRLSND
jgi:hypothetical protein